MGYKAIVGSLFMAASLQGGVSFAQETAVPAKSGGSEASTTNEGIVDIVVTATKRSERIQAVPVAVTALDAQALERLQINNLADAGAGAPNMTIFRNPSSSSSSLIYMRGIGDDSSNILREFPVSQYIDGVYVGRNLGALADMIGYDRIEILRGPQGTLYGRNSTGGAVKLVTTRPQFDSFSVKGDFTIGSFEERDFRALVNIPIADRLAANVAIGSTNNDGYYTNVATGGGLNRRDIQSVRTGVLFDATDKLSFYLTGDYTHDNSGLQVPTQMSSTTGTGKDVPLYGGDFDAKPDLPDINRGNFWGVGLQTDYSLEFGNLQSITAYRGVDMRANYDYGGAPIGADLIRDVSQTQFSQELQFTSDFDGPFQFVSGLFYYHEKGHGYEGFIFTAGGSPTNYTFDQISDSYAAYAEGNYTFTSWLTGTVGVRVTHDSKELAREVVFDGVTASDSWTRFTPKVGLKAQLDEHIMAYASFSKGYKSGIYLPFPGNAVQAATALPPEGVNAYEVGLKADWLGGKLRTNLALFDNSYKNLQIGVLTSGGATGAVSADEHARGLELEVTATPTENLFVSGAFTLLDTEFTRVPTGSSSYPVLGDEQKFSPPKTFRINADYDIPFDGGQKVTLGVAYSWYDKQAQGFPNTLYKMDAYDLVDARIAFTPAGEHWGLELAAKNLADTRYWTYQSYLAGYARYYAPGRTWSLRLKFDL